jgi:hypothetical protein
MLRMCAGFASFSACPLYVALFTSLCKVCYPLVGWYTVFGIPYTVYGISYPVFFLVRLQDQAIRYLDI